MRLSIRMRLTLWNASVLALVLGTFAVAGWLTLTTTLQQRTDTAVRESARVVAGAIRAERAAAQARGDVEEVRGETEQAVLRELRVGDLEVFIADEGTQLMAARQPGPERHLGLPVCGGDVEADLVEQAGGAVAHLPGAGLGVVPAGEAEDVPAG